MSNKSKTCKTCKQNKPLSEFRSYQQSRFGKTYICRVQICEQCKSDETKIDYHLNKRDDPDFKKWKRVHTRKYNLGKLGVTIEDYNKLVEKQNGLCAICGQVETVENQFGPRSLCVDHDHKTGKVRGLLCSLCNHLLGNAKDNLEILQKAITYLKG